MDINYSYDSVPTIKKFSSSNAFIRGLMGPFGCLAGDTLVITEEGAIPIAGITRPMRVLSWNAKNNRFQLSLSGGSYPKGADYLYRVTMPQGVFDAAGSHLVFCADGNYRRVDDLLSGNFLSLCFESRDRTRSAFFRKLSHVSGRHSLRTIADSMGHYAELARLYGQQLLAAEGIGQASPPLIVCAERLLPLHGFGVAAQMDDQWVLSQAHNRHSRSSGRIQIDDYDSRTLHRGRVSGCPAPLLIAVRTWSLILRIWQLLRKFFSRHTPRKLYENSHSCDRTLSERPILSIERLPSKQAFWDLQVLDTHNYVTIDGAIHHNSGKSSGCVIDILRRAKAQTPSPDGVRRSQWAVIRNTYLQLRDTTFPIFQRWIPPAFFGTYSEDRHEYHITNLPGCDVMIKFRALDRPDHVANLLSSWYTGAWINEAREIPWAVVAALQGRVGRFYPEIESWSGIIMDTNPPDIDAWWYALFEERRVPHSHGEPSAAEAKLLAGCEIFKQPSGLSAEAENLPNLKEGYYSSLLMDDNAKRVYIDGEYGFLLEGKPVYPEYKDNLHCKELPYIKSLPVYRGWDFGLTPACVMAQTPGGRINIIDELCADQMGADSFGDQVLLHCGKYIGPFIDVGDPSGMDPSQADEKTCFEILQAKGINISGGGLPRTVTQSVELRTGAVRKGLRTLVDGRPMLMLDPKCKMILKGFNGAYQYRRLQVAANRYTEKPEKTEYSHPHDALQYIMVHLIGNTVRGVRDSGVLPKDWHEPYDLLKRA